MKSASEWINDLQLAPHTEGGYFRQVEKSRQKVTGENGERSLYTSIHFLLTESSPSHFHRLKADEIWYFHAGAPLLVHCIFPDGRYQKVALGTAIAEGQQLSYCVPKGTIFGSSVARDYALVSCLVTPGFEDADFQLFTQAELLADYPQHEKIIQALAYESLPK
ncbi:putative cupin superfamily sugar epimerase [Enterococcus sp. PF1-24]|uniref:cupin domain-containing protein n=1 Tax=unclassified Enterococcus TaxID=2608891 RepID=UPI002475E2E1|nr:MULTISPECIES: cupin domain-containing protein [unclassified Enterococcus]MDH6363760.1 putative cupin superfamily sugar epimerase [Enterococcus sp. PFB1-1]MDH6400716.1 putative cupin superfamily sugar epimerase [Enterococcus sp. PF1-24]